MTQRSFVYQMVPTGEGRHIRIEGCITRKMVKSATAPFFLIAMKETDEVIFSRDWSLYSLTKREAEIAEYVCQGLSNKRISETLFISLNTVETHLKNIFKKTGITNRTSLLALSK
jgi:DNA-binding CsgD family transcriptional regulator